jgi:hypothetical protein
LSEKQSRSAVKAATLRKISLRLVPFLSLLYFAAFIDRVDVGFAASQMTRDLGFSAYVFGLPTSASRPAWSVSSPPFPTQSPPLP